jgi:hypothetical protein
MVDIRASLVMAEAFRSKFTPDGIKKLAKDRLGETFYWAHVTQN